MKTNRPDPIIPPVLAIGLGILAVSTASIFIRYAQVDAPSLVIAAYRLAIASLLLIPFVYKRRQEFTILSGKEKLLAILSGTFLAVHFAAWITSLEYTTVASSVVLVSTTPLFIAVFSPFTIKEPITTLIAIGMIIAMAGSAIVGLDDTCSIVSANMRSLSVNCPPFDTFIRGKAFTGDILALVGAAAGAIYVIIGRHLRVKLSLLSYIFAVYGTAALILVIWALASGYEPFGYQGNTYIWFFLLALIPQLIGHSTFNWALGYLSAAFVSITLLGEPIGSAMLAYIFLDEQPSFIKIFGAILIFAGILVASRSEQRSRELLYQAKIPS